MLNVNPFLHFMILVKIILDKSRASPAVCCSIPARLDRHLSKSIPSSPPDATQTNPNIEGSSVSACKQKTGTIVGPVYFNGGFAVLV